MPPMTEPGDDDPRPTLSTPVPEDVLEAVEALRTADFSDVPAELLSAVLRAERDNLDDREAARRAVARQVETYLAAEQAAQPAAERNREEE